MSGAALPTGEAGRALFALEPGFVQLNQGSFGATPREVLRAQDRERAALEADPVTYMKAVEGRLRAILGRLAPRVGARADDLAFVENATSGVSAVLRSLDVRPGDRLVTTTHAYVSVRDALRWLARRTGAHLVEVPLPFPVEGPGPVLDAWRRALPGARLAVVDAITSPTGLVLPLAGLVDACRVAGVPVLVDAAHAPGQIPLDLDGLGADWVTGNLHKWWFAPKGTAILWARRDRQRDLVPPAIGYHLDQGFPRMFDWVGTRDPSGWVAFDAALRFTDRLGMARIQHHGHALAAWAAEQLAERWSVALPAPAAMRASMATLPLPVDLPEAQAEPFRLALRREGIGVPVIPFGGRCWIRISAQLYNAPGDYVRLADTVSRLLA